MGANGAWRLEELSGDGWAYVGTAFFLEDGRYLRGGTDAYTVGEGDRVMITATSTRLGGPGVAYGKDTGEVEIEVRGELKDGEINAQATDGKFTIHYRFTRLGDIP